MSTEPTQTFTVLCRQSNNSGTTWISSVQAADLAEAIAKGIEQCAADWSMELEAISVIGVLEGDVNFLHWSDEVFC